jgi:hypothetical protein
MKYDWTHELGPGAIEHALALLDTGGSPTVGTAVALSGNAAAEMFRYPMPR